MYFFVITGLTNFPSVPIHIRKNGKKAVVVDFASGSHEGEAGQWGFFFPYK